MVNVDFFIATFFDFLVKAFKFVQTTATRPLYFSAAAA